VGILSFKTDAAWDLVSLGEVMLRLDPGEGRVRTARSFQVWEGGGEYNVARGLSRCFGLKTAVATALPDNELGRLTEGLMLQGGVDLGLVRWRPFDGLGRDSRVGLNFTERGFGVRAALGISDRANSCASKIAPGDFDWKAVFEQKGARVFHTGGIFAALSASTGEAALEAMRAARNAGTVVSYDLNYRSSLWKSSGGPERAAELNLRLVSEADVLFGNEEDFSAALGFGRGSSGKDFDRIDPASYEGLLRQVQQAFPNLKVVAATLRRAATASRNDWGAVAFSDGIWVSATQRNDLEILDRVGGGDSFASGFLYAMLRGKSLKDAVEYGAAHGALAMTTPGDTSMASLKEVEKLIGSKTARVDR
jgi:2-dehydro-3-deoxygluconokinase